MFEARLRPLAFWVCVVFGTTTAWGGSSPTLIVPPLGESADEAASKAIVQAFRQTEKIQVVDLSAVGSYLAQFQPGGTGEGAKEAARLLKEGQEAYRDLKLKESISLLEKAKILYRNQLSQPENFEGLRACQFHLAMGYLSLKDEARAKEELKEIYRLDPERDSRKLSVQAYPPPIRELYKKVRTEMVKGERGSLEVKSQPTGALVYVNGASTGAAPVVVNELPVGEHFLSLSLKGHESRFSSKYVVVGANQFQGRLEEAQSQDYEKYFRIINLEKKLDHHRLAFLDEMGLKLGGDIFVFLTPGQGEVHGQLYDQRSQEMSAKETGNDPKALVAKLLDSLDADGYVIRGQMAPPSEPPKKKTPLSAQPLPSAVPTPGPAKQPGLSSSSRPWYQNPWIWAAVGGGLLLAGGSVLLFSDVAKSSATTSTVRVTIPGP